MAYCTGSAKALVQMINSSGTHEKSQSSVYDYFPECLEASRERMGLPPLPDEDLDDEVDEEVDVDEEVEVEVESKEERDDEGEWIVI